MRHCYLVGKGKVLSEGEPSEEGLKGTLCFWLGCGWAARTGSSGWAQGGQDSETKREAFAEKIENGKNIRQWRKEILRDLIWSGLYLSSSQRARPTVKQGRALWTGWAWVQGAKGAQQQSLAGEGHTAGTYAELANQACALLATSTSSRGRAGILAQ